MLELEKKEFNRSECFTFFEKWLDAISELRQIPDGDILALNLYEAIAEYSLYEVAPDFSDYPVLKCMWPIFERDIKASVEHRSRNFKNEDREKKEACVVQLYIDNPNVTNEKIAEMASRKLNASVSKSTAHRIYQKYSEKIAEGRRQRENEGTDITVNDMNLADTEEPF